jgi:hypothetical protein
LNNGITLNIVEEWQTMTVEAGRQFHSAQLVIHEVNTENKDFDMESKSIRCAKIMTNFSSILERFNSVPAMNRFGSI